MKEYFTILNNDISKDPILIKINIDPYQNTRTKNPITKEISISLNNITQDILAMYLYIYFPTRQRRDYYEMIYVNIL